MSTPAAPVDAPRRHAPATTPALPLETRLAAVEAFMDHRLAEAAAAVDVNTAVRLPDIAPVALADVVQLPVDTRPATVPCPYATPIASTLWAAARVLEERGHNRGSLRADTGGAVCLLGALRTAAGGNRGLETDAATLLLDVIRRDFGNHDTVPSFNDDRRTSPADAVRALDSAARHADARTL